jgi:hypothetical protein
MARVSRTSRWIVVAAIAGLASCGYRSHEQLAGQYAFSTVQVLTDPCGLMPAAGLWGGSLVKTGDYVRLTYELEQMWLVGYYRYDLEEFYLDGTATEVVVDAPADAGVTSCKLDQLRVHLDAVTRSPDRFDGTLTVTYDVNPESPFACECRMSVIYQADLQAP